MPVCNLDGGDGKRVNANDATLRLSSKLPGDIDRTVMTERT